MPDYLAWLENVTVADVTEIREKDKQYGGSWQKRGGTGAFMMLARKWDRLEEYVENNCNYDVFKAIETDPRKEGVLSDIGDLRRYLILVEAYIIAKNHETAQDILGRKDIVGKTIDKTGQKNPFGYRPEEESDLDRTNGKPSDTE